MMEVLASRDERCVQLAKMLFPDEEHFLGLRLCIEYDKIVGFEAEVYTTNREGKIAFPAYTKTLFRTLTSAELDKLLEIFK